MKGYLKSDDILFLSGNEITRGWATVLARYQKRYPDKAAMGRLTAESIGRPLPGRRNLVITRGRRVPFDGQEIAASGPGIRIGNPARRRALVPGSEPLRGVPQAGHPGLGVVALGDDSGDAPADASQWTLCALRHVVVHSSSSVSGHLFAGHY